MPMDKKLYPADWENIAHSIKTEAGWICQDCGRQCKRPDQSWGDFVQTEAIELDPEFKRGRYVLTVAHLNHIPADCRRENLKALCSGCHLRYDGRQMALKRRLKRERLGQLSLF